MAQHGDIELCNDQDRHAERGNPGSQAGSQTATVPPVIRLTRDEMRELVRQGRCSKITLEFAESARLLRLLCCRRPAGGPVSWLAQPASSN